jgi:hypothetical protein
MESSCEYNERTRGGLPVGVLAVVLTTPHRKKYVTECSKAPRTWTDFLAQTIVRTIKSKRKPFTTHGTDVKCVKQKLVVNLKERDQLVDPGVDETYGS